MGKVAEGRYEISTTKADAISKFRQLQGLCREEISGGNELEFNCYKNGRIVITNPSRKRRSRYTNSTNLYAEIMEEDGKTYVSYYTEFSKSNNVFKCICYAISVIFCVLGIALGVISENKIFYVVFFALGLITFVSELGSASREGKNSRKDSEILIAELEKRVEAVNLWDK